VLFRSPQNPKTPNYLFINYLKKCIVYDSFYTARTNYSSIVTFNLLRITF